MLSEARARGRTKFAASIAMGFLGHVVLFSRFFR
jgi:hypothetical protein